MEVKHIVLETDEGKKIKLTLDQAKQLHSQLNDLLGENKTVINNHPYTVPYYDHWLPPTFYPIHQHDTVWCGTTASTTTITDGSMLTTNGVN